MKGWRIVPAMVLGSLLFSSVSASAADVTAGVDVNSAYVWRGITLNDGMVVQPSLLLNKEAFELYFWGNINIDDYGKTLETDELSEIDIDISYARTLAGIGVKVGVIEYLYPNDGSVISTNGEPVVQSGTGEVYAQLSRELGAGISLSLDAFYDFDEVKDGYGKLTVKHDGALGGEVLVTTGASLGLAGRETSRAASSTGKDGLHEYEVFVRLAYATKSGVGFSALIAYTDTADKDVLPEQDTNVYGGVGLKYLF